MKTEKDSASCPDCRSRSLHRRRRAGFWLFLAGILGKWPYRCDACGSEFFLNRRYANQRSEPARHNHPAA
jgi:DNA-directed RNA polymerase subunit RPC12/RpoP